MSESSVEFPLDFTSIADELRKQAKELAKADKQLDQIQVKAADLARKNAAIARLARAQQLQSMGMMARSSGIDVSGSVMASFEAHQRAGDARFSAAADNQEFFRNLIRSRTPRFSSAQTAAAESDAASRAADAAAAADDAFWSGRVFAARTDAIHAGKLAPTKAAPGGSAQVSAGEIAGAFKSALSTVTSFGIGVGSAAQAVSVFGRAMVSNIEKKSALMESDNKSTVKIGAAAGMVGMDPRVLEAMVNSTQDRHGAVSAVEQYTKAAFLRQTVFSQERLSAMLAAGNLSGDFTGAASLAIAGNIPALNRIAGVNIGVAGRSARDALTGKTTSDRNVVNDIIEKEGRAKSMRIQSDIERMQMESPFLTSVVPDAALGAIAERNVENRLFTNYYDPKMSTMAPSYGVQPAAAPVPGTALPTGRYGGEAGREIAGAIRDANATRAPSIDRTGNNGGSGQ